VAVRVTRAQLHIGKLRARTGRTSEARNVRPRPREPEQTFDAIAIPVLFMPLFTYLVGGALSGSPRE
jgi:hypothetical protein